MKENTNAPGPGDAGLTEKTLSEEYLYKGKILCLRRDRAQLPNGRVASREVVEHPGGVGVLALDDQNNVFLVRQFRYPYGEILTEIPAGKLTPGEDPLEAGKRELREETGLTADEYISLGKLYPSPGYTDEVIHLYLARSLHFGEQQPDDDEFLRVVKLPFAQAVQRVLSGALPDSKTQAAVLKAEHLLARRL